MFSIPKQISPNSDRLPQFTCCHRIPRPRMGLSACRGRRRRVRMCDRPVGWSLAPVKVIEIVLSMYMYYYKANGLPSLT